MPPLLRVASSLGDRPPGGTVVRDLGTGDGSVHHTTSIGRPDNHYKLKNALRAPDPGRPQRAHGGGTRWPITLLEGVPVSPSTGLHVFG